MWGESTHKPKFNHFKLTKRGGGDSLYPLSFLLSDFDREVYGESLNPPYLQLSDTDREIWGLVVGPMHYFLIGYSY